MKRSRGPARDDNQEATDGTNVTDTDAPLLRPRESPDTPTQNNDTETPNDPSARRQESTNDVADKGSRNTSEFDYALVTLPLEQFPTYVREFDNILTFPEKLMLMLEYIERLCCTTALDNNLSEPIHWTRCGTAIVIRDSVQFCETWPTRFFGNVKYTSFIRKLYRWGFCKMFAGNYGLDNVPVFAHEHFLRDHKDKLWTVESTMKKFDPQRQPKGPVIETSSNSTIEAIASVTNSTVNSETVKRSTTRETSSREEQVASEPNPPDPNNNSPERIAPHHHHHHHHHSQATHLDASSIHRHLDASIHSSLIVAWLQQQQLQSSVASSLTQEEIYALIAVLLLQHDPR